METTLNVIALALIAIGFMLAYLCIDTAAYRLKERRIEKERQKAYDEILASRSINPYG